MAQSVACPPLARYVVSSPLSRVIAKTIIKMCVCVCVFVCVELAWRSGSVMDCHATARGAIPDGNDVKTELHVLRNGQ